MFFFLILTSKTAVTPVPGQEGLCLKAVIGYNGNGRDNMIWNPDSGEKIHPIGAHAVCF